MLCLSGFELYSRWVPLSNLLQPLSSKVWIFRKIEEADSLSVRVYGSSLVAKRNTAINISTRTHPQ